MTRAFLIVLDSVGCGGAPDAADFGDAGANTLGHICQTTNLRMPVLNRLGLGAAIQHATGFQTGWPAPDRGGWAVATEVSNGKDTPSGHWELTGVPVPWDWHAFPNTTPAFGDAILQRMVDLAGGSLANCHASGLPVIDEYGAQHLKTGFPICYTSVDSVFQIAAHEDHFGLDRLYDVCRDMAQMLHPMKVGRVIARPFVGTPGAFERTTNRKDFAIPPPSPTLCDWASDAGRAVHAIGKIGDIFSMQGITDVVKGRDQDLMDHLSDAVDHAADGSLIFANFVEFDTLYGHQRDPQGYARHLRWFDDAIGPILDKTRPGDLVIFTADHGNDPTWTGTDHTRERVPVLVHGRPVGAIGDIAFVDVAASIADHLGIPNPTSARSFL
ncbi:MAG: phosphopentomutase [Pseudomonadota bacterium]